MQPCLQELQTGAAVREPQRRTHLLSRRVQETRLMMTLADIDANGDHMRSISPPPPARTLAPTVGLLRAARDIHTLVGDTWLPEGTTTCSSAAARAVGAALSVTRPNLSE